jgi:hypothetical protein
MPAPAALGNSTLLRVQLAMFAVDCCMAWAGGEVVEEQVSVIGGAAISRSPLGAALQVQGQLRIGARIRVPGALARATAEKDPSVGVPEPDLVYGGWRPIWVRAWRCRQRDAPRWPRGELSPWRCPFWVARV